MPENVTHLDTLLRELHATSNEAAWERRVIESRIKAVETATVDGKKYTTLSDVYEDIARNYDTPGGRSEHLLLLDDIVKQYDPAGKGRERRAPLETIKDRNELQEVRSLGKEYDEVASRAARNGDITVRVIGATTHERIDSKTNMRCTAYQPVFSEPEATSAAGREAIAKLSSIATIMITAMSIDNSHKKNALNSPEALKQNTAFGVAVLRNLGSEKLQSERHAQIIKDLETQARLLHEAKAKEEKDRAGSGKKTMSAIDPLSPSAIREAGLRSAGEALSGPTGIDTVRTQQVALTQTGKDPSLSA